MTMQRFHRFRKLFFLTTLTLAKLRGEIIAQTDYTVPINMPYRPGWTLYFQDEFDSPNLDTTATIWWSQETEREKENALFRYANVSVKNSCLHLTLRKERVQKYEYTAGMVYKAEPVPINTYTEISCKVPKGLGFWPAFWFWVGAGETYQEIDVAEFTGQKPFQFQANNYYWDAKRKKIRCDCKRIWPIYPDGNTIDVTEIFHVYGVEWTEKYIRYYFDNQLVREIKKNIPKNPMGLILGMGLYPNENPPEAALPAHFMIDYVRIFKKNK
jgi:beta-glucanase (GH16 family)